MIATLLLALAIQMDAPQEDPAPSPYEGHGKLATTHLDTKIPRKAGDAEAQIHYPSEEKGPFPVIVFSGGGEATNGKEYDLFGKWYASWGYVTALMTFNNNDFDKRASEFGEVADWFTKKNEEDGWALKGKIDTAKFIAMGHSTGGTTSLICAKRDKRFVACVAYGAGAPKELKGDCKPAVLLLTGSNNDEKAAIAMYKKFEKPKVRVTVDGMDHYFKPVNKYAPVVAKYTVAFLDTIFKNDEKAVAVLKGEEAVVVESDR